MLEAARLYPPVGGLTKLAVEPKRRELGNGGTLLDAPGTSVMLWTSAANYDPHVFGGPAQSADYAKRFIPGRENADRLLTWVAELRDLNKCPDAAGCAHAPRPCPGTHLALYLATEASKAFVAAAAEREAVAAARGKKDEL